MPLERAVDSRNQGGLKLDHISMSWPSVPRAVDPFMCDQARSRFRPVPSRLTLHGMHCLLCCQP